MEPEEGQIWESKYGFEVEVVETTKSLVAFKQVGAWSVCWKTIDFFKESLTFKGYKRKEIPPDQTPVWVWPNYENRDDKRLRMSSGEADEKGRLKVYCDGRAGGQTYPYENWEVVKS